MKVKELKLVDNGFRGLIIKGQEPVTGENVFYIDDVSRERKTPVAEDVLDKINKLVYYYLNITGHWIPPYDKFIDDNKNIIEPEEITKAYQYFKKLIDNTSISELRTNDNSFMIIGSIESVDGKPVNISTPKITIEDDLGFYGDAIEAIEEALRAAYQWVITKALPTVNIVKKMIQQKGSDKEQEQLSSMSEEEIINLAMEKFQKSGAVVLMSEASEEQMKRLAADARDEVSVHNSGSIDADRQREAEEEIEPESQAEPEEDPESAWEDEASEDETSEDLAETEDALETDNAPPVEYAEEEVKQENIPQINPDKFGPPASEREFKDLKNPNDY